MWNQSKAKLVKTELNEYHSQLINSIVITGAIDPEW